MSEHRPFAVDQAEGLRQMFASQHRMGSVVGFISSGRDSAAGLAIERLSSRLREMDKHVLLVDEQPAGRSGLKGGLVLSRPMGAGEPLTEMHRRQYDLILVDAYPSRDSQVHRADMLVIVSKAPDFDAATTSRILKAVSRAPQELGLLLLPGSGSRMQMLGCRRAIEDIAEQSFGRQLSWIGAIPVHEAGGATDAVDAAASRLCQLQPIKELSDV